MIEQNEGETEYGVSVDERVVPVYLSDPKPLHGVELKVKSLTQGSENVIVLAPWPLSTVE